MSGPVPCSTLIDALMAEHWAVELWQRSLPSRFESSNAALGVAHAAVAELLPVDVCEGRVPA